MTGRTCLSQPGAVHFLCSRGRRPGCNRPPPKPLHSGKSQPGCRACTSPRRLSSSTPGIAPRKSRRPAPPRRVRGVSPWRSLQRRRRRPRCLQRVGHLRSQWGVRRAVKGNMAYHYCIGVVEETPKMPAERIQVSLPRARPRWSLIGPSRLPGQRAQQPCRMQIG